MKEKGIVLIIAFIVLGLLLILATYFLSLTLSELRISNNQEKADQAYYLAESGINIAIWKLENDDTNEDGDVAWKTCFISADENCPDCNSWSESFTKDTSSLIKESKVSVSIQNSSCGRGEIISVSEISKTKRIIKAKVFKSLASQTEDAAVFSGGPSERIYISDSKLKINNGNLFSNQNLEIKGFSKVEVYDNPNTDELEGKVMAVGDLIGQDKITESQAKCAKNVCTELCQNCPPDSISLPSVDFDSDSANSFKKRAENLKENNQCQVLCKTEGGSQYQCSDECIFNEDDFEDILWEVRENGTVTLNNEITYVEGIIDLRGGRRLVVNGTLLADKTINIGERYKWKKGDKSDKGFSQIEINQPNPKAPSGLLTKSKINFGPYSSFKETNIKGVIYSNNEARFVSMQHAFNITGAVIARKISLQSLWQYLIINLDNDIIRRGLGYLIDDTVVYSQYSAVVTTQHWEESY